MLSDFPFAEAAIRGLLLSAASIIWVIVLVRLNGLRTFSKMTNFDFAMTIAVGSLIATGAQTTSWTSFVQILAAILGLVLVQRFTASLRMISGGFSKVVQNTPIILMRDGVMIDDALKHTRVARDNLVAKLREANVLDFTQVRAVVLETTGDISVLHGDALQEALLDGSTDLRKEV